MRDLLLVTSYVAADCDRQQELASRHRFPISFIDIGNVCLGLGFRSWLKPVVPKAEIRYASFHPTCGYPPSMDLHPKGPCTQ